jgi:Domain of unknown function (DUF4388)
MDFQGSLTEFQLPDIVQFLSGARKTGVLRLMEGNKRTGEIFLDKGRIMHAVLGETSGEEAVYELFLWNEGEFLFEPGVTTDESSVSKGNTNLLMEAARRRDEWQVISKQIPSIDWIPEFVIPDENETGGQINLNTSEWILLSKIDGKRSLKAIAEAADLSVFHTGRLLYGLASTKLIRLRKPDEDAKKTS